MAIDGGGGGARPAAPTLPRPGVPPLPAPDPDADTNPGHRLIPVGRFRGVPLYLAPSWLIIAAFITIGYSGLVRRLTDGVSLPESYLLAFAYAVALALSVLLHEIGHTAVSLALGNPVRRIVIFLLGGVSEIGQEPERARDEFLVSAAGPLVSLVIAGAAWGGALGFEQNTVPWLLCSLLMFSNLIVAVFNLLPGLPLDGGRVLRSIVWGAGGSALTGTRVAAWAGRAIAVALLLSCALLVPHSWGLTSVVITAMVAGFIWIGATQSLRTAELDARLPGLDMRRLLRRGIFVPPDMSVALAVQHARDARANGLVVVDSADRPQAIVEEARVKALPPDQQPWTPVSSLARPIGAGSTLPMELSGRDLLDAVTRSPAPEYLVLDAAGAPAGILSAVDLARVLSTR